MFRDFVIFVGRCCSLCRWSFVISTYHQRTDYIFKNNLSGITLRDLCERFSFLPFILSLVPDYLFSYVASLNNYCRSERAIKNAATASSRCAHSYIII